jgi:hypothetical protein
MIDPPDQPTGGAAELPRSRTDAERRPAHRAMNQHQSDRARPRSTWTSFAVGGAALAALAWTHGLAAAAPAPASFAQENEKDLKAEFDKRFEAAKSDVAKLWELYDWCEAFGLQKYHKRVVNAVLKLDENDRRAHETLGHEEYDGKWWDDPKKLEKHRLEKEKVEAEAKGWVIYKGRYVDPKDIPFIERGLVKDESGKWIDKEVQEKLAAGFVRQDLEWIAPDQKENIDKGLWKCGEQWLELDAANTYHALAGREWRIPYGDDLVIRTTLPRATADEIAKDLQRAARDTERFFGRPAYNVHVFLLRSLDQFNEFSGGGVTGAPGADILGWSAVRGAFLADGNYDVRTRKLDAIGVGLWDLDDANGPRFGRHFSRFAYGIAAVEAIDNSPDARKKMETAGMTDATVNAFYGEKFLPPLLRFGFASYCDRYFLDHQAGSGGDTQWARKWSVQNITSLGGLDPIARLIPFQFDNSTEQGAGETTKLLNQAGLVVSFILDGKCEPVVTAHTAFKAAVVSGDTKAIKSAADELLDAVRKNEPAYRRWAES